jgi:hypothetical protein
MPHLCRHGDPGRIEHLPMVGASPRDRKLESIGNCADPTRRHPHLGQATLPPAALSWVFAASSKVVMSASAGATRRSCRGKVVVQPLRTNPAPRPVTSELAIVAARDGRSVRRRI